MKMKSPELCSSIVDRCGGSVKFNHSDGNVSDVAVSHAGYGIRTIRVFELPFEIPPEELNVALRPYGRIISNVAERWSEAHMFPVLNGVRQIKIELQKHVPSYLNICGYRALIIYDGQPRTCALCNSTEHIRAECSRRRVPQLPRDEMPSSGPVVGMKLSYAAAADFRSRGESVPPVRGEPAASRAVVDDTPASSSRFADGLPISSAPLESMPTPTFSNSPTVVARSSADSAEDPQIPATEVSLRRQDSHQREDIATSFRGVDAPGIHSAGTMNEDSNLDIGFTLAPTEDTCVKETTTSDSVELETGLLPVGAMEKDAPPSAVVECDTRTFVRKKEQATSDVSSGTSPDRSQTSSPARSPKRSSKKGKKRRLAHKAAESLAPALREKLKHLRDNERLREQCPVARVNECTEAEMSRADADDLHQQPRAPLGVAGLQTGTTMDLDRTVSGKGLDWADAQEDRTDHGMEMDLTHASGI
ncbi:uncharacterized protein LOC126272115 [Schistocerca gregaria]|uniref:uncharacterized protein LOC126272114 n=1 Tax=Schistocerca gregaria TaxID=7010 RepID=UPI00211F411B|nr:uncharacterized protein LOC126272114 [Schistocerca gregaria]XP_049830669.1 uncharacterized protein LOC126272115 [Schistocerca gregaria]